MAAAVDESVDAVRCWNDGAGPRWVALQDRIDAQLAPLGDAVLSKLDVQHGERAIDVGCGCGHTLRKLATRVGDGGQLLGIDISEPMLVYAREHLPEDVAPRVQLVCDDAERYRFGAGCYDVVFSRFGVMFFNNAEAAFKNLRRALGPGGRLGFVCWQSLGDNEWARLPFQAVLDALTAAPGQPPDLPPMFRPNAPGPFSLADANQLFTLLERSGFSQIDIEDRRGPVALGGAGTLEEAVDFAMQIGPASHVVREADPALHPLLADAIRQALAPYAGPEGVWMQSASYAVIAAC